MQIHHTIPFLSSIWLQAKPFHHAHLSFLSATYASINSKSQTDVIYLDFTVSPTMNLLLVKLWSIGKTNNLYGCGSEPTYHIEFSALLSIITTLISYQCCPEYLKGVYLVLYYCQWPPSISLFLEHGTICPIDTLMMQLELNDIYFFVKCLQGP